LVSFFKKGVKMNRLKAAWTAFKDPEVVDVRDQLTGALNRKTFIRIAERELSRALRVEALPFSLVFVDLDNLKEVNDLHGHRAGDEMIKTFAGKVKSQIRPYDIFSRWGGDEFILFFPQANSGKADKIMKRIHDSFPYFSWGTSSSEEGLSLKYLINKADAKMYRLKKTKKLK
jgi:diguanylate cyclase (GGDEF)-like protein